MPNYIISQRHKMACGAVALVNLFKHLGNLQASYKTVLEMREAGFWDVDEGTDYRIMSKCLDLHEMPHTKHKFDSNKLSDILKDGKLALVFVEYEDYCHVFAVVGETKEGYIAPNSGIGNKLICKKEEVKGTWMWEIS